MIEVNLEVIREIDTIINFLENVSGYDYPEVLILVKYAEDIKNYIINGAYF